MKKTLLSLIPAIALVLTLGLFTHTVSAQERQAPKAVWTLDGKTLNDFECFLDGGVKKEDVFKLEDGILKVGGTPFGWLAPKDLKLRNFVLTAEICYPTDDPNVNSGFFLRMTDGEDRPTPAFLPPCIECQLQTQNMGHLFGFHGHTLIGAAERYDYRPRSVDGEKVRAELHRVKNVKNAQKPGKEWNKMVIICHEDSIFVLLNGQPVNWVCNASNIEGKFAFQSEGGEIWFRNVKIDHVVTR